MHAQVRALFAGMRPVLRGYAAGNGAEAARRLIALGEDQEALGRYRNARRCYESALALALPLAEKGPQIVALRRAARIARVLGELDDALLHYRRSGELAGDADDRRGEVIAYTGVGNVLAVQGRWAGGRGGVPCGAGLRGAPGRRRGNAPGGSAALQQSRHDHHAAEPAGRGGAVGLRCPAALGRARLAVGPGDLLSEPGPAAWAAGASQRGTRDLRARAHALDSARGARQPLPGPGGVVSEGWAPDAGARLRARGRGAGDRGAVALLSGQHLPGAGQHRAR